MPPQHSFSNLYVVIFVQIYIAGSKLFTSNLLDWKIYTFHFYSECLASHFRRILTEILSLNTDRRINIVSDSRPKKTVYLIKLRGIYFSSMCIVQVQEVKRAVSSISSGAAGPAPEERRGGKQEVNGNRKHVSITTMDQKKEKFKSLCCFYH